MYYTEQSNSLFLHSDCLYYNVLNGADLYHEDEKRIKLTESTAPLNRQFILYCRRDWTRVIDSLLIKNSYHRRTSFAKLRQLNFTSEQLYRWSVPIDIVERYQIYLMNNGTTTETNDFIIKCTLPYFGSYCQYRFLQNPALSISDIVKRAFIVKSSSDKLTKLTCFAHLNCIRGPDPVCLDWREVCNNQIDCIDGEDEEHCSDLELNECQDHEFRCQNGQCIPKTFLRDNYLNPDCLDRTDESSNRLLYPSSCGNDPSFRCEDLQCRPHKSRSFVCGDGQCELIMDQCANQRGALHLNRFLRASNVSNECVTAMMCVTRQFMDPEYERRCSFFCHQQSCAERITRACPPLFAFPSYPILFGHVTFIYRNEQLDYHKARLALPSFICYDAYLCSTLVTKSDFVFGELDCSDLLNIIDPNTIRNGFHIHTQIFDLFRTCSSSRHPITGNGTHCPDLFLYPCINTSKCISKYRLLDGIRDCEQGDDESYPLSCFLPDKDQRFTCPNNVSQCMSSFRLNDGIKDCPKNEDEIESLVIDSQNRILFQTICDGFTELVPFVDNNRNLTDETDCEQWPCDNVYTRCDGVWNCANGSDEISCSCEGQWCVSPITLKLMCLPAINVSNGEVDCAGGTDEQQYCRMAEKTNFDARFLCRNSFDKCVTRNLLCNTINNCPDSDDETFCQHYSLSVFGQMGSLCYLGSISINLTETERFLCQLTDSSKRKVVYFSLGNRALTTTSQRAQSTKTKRSNKIETDDWLNSCNRGLPVVLRYIDTIDTIRCLCPPAYYGERCEYQNERISLTIKLYTAPPDWRTVFAIIILLIDDQQGLIESADEIIYNHLNDCRVKSDVNLLYSTRPKNTSKTYSIHIDVFNKQTFAYHSSWIFPVHFPYLPVYRLAIELNLPVFNTQYNCLLNCSNHGQCMTYENDKKQQFCLCEDGWTGTNCSEEVHCSCAPNAKCITSSLCICKRNRFGNRCFLSDTRCQSSICQNNGVCHSPFPHDPTATTTCICPQGHFGRFCQRVDIKIVIKFIHMSIPLNILIHFIETFPSATHLRTTTFKKITIGQNKVTISTSIQFHLIFVEFQSNYYLLYTNASLIYIRPPIDVEVMTSRRCLSISELFNDTFVNQHLLIRIKYYHLICQKHPLLFCFYDNVHMCLCTENRHANCFEFNHNMTYNCRNLQYCKNNGKCFQNNPDCPTSLMCVCEDCYYGSQCQLSTIGFSLSLDAILGYQVSPQISFIHQTLAVKISTVISSILFLLGFISGILCIITFRRTGSQNVGSGLYLFTSSICSIITITLLQYKFWFLVLSQMSMTTNYSILLINCIIIDYMLRSFLSLGDWLNAYVAIERTVSTIQGVKFNKSQSIRLSKSIIFFVIIITFVSHLQDPFHRRLMNDVEEKRIWCITQYSSSYYALNTTMTVFHFVTPFIINILSAICITIRIVQQKLRVEKKRLENEFQQSPINEQHSPMEKQPSTIEDHQFTTKMKLIYKRLVYQHIRKHKHILISPCIFILLALPRLIISFSLGCMKSQRDPWLFLIGYFVSFLPSISHFIVFVLPSEVYRKQFQQAILRIRRRVHRN